MNLLLIYLILINAVGFLLMLADKWKAVKNRWRIPEKVLLGVGILGGSIGCILGMRLFRHKTLHPMFSIGLPLILAVQVILAVLILPNFL